VGQGLGWWLRARIVITKTMGRPCKDGYDLLYAGTPVGNGADFPEPLLRPSLATGHGAEMLDVSDPYVGYEAEAFP
jgi:hypothetical protein